MTEVLREGTGRDEILGNLGGVIVGVSPYCPDSVEYEPGDGVRRFAQVCSPEILVFESFGMEVKFSVVIDLKNPAAESGFAEDI